MMYCRQHQASQPLTLAEQAAEKDRQHAKKRSLFEQNEHDERGAIGRLFMSDEGMLNIQAQAAILARRVKLAAQTPSAATSQPQGSHNRHQQVQGDAREAAILLRGSPDAASAARNTAVATEDQASFARLLDALVCHRKDTPTKLTLETLGDESNHRRTGTGSSDTSSTGANADHLHHASGLVNHHDDAATRSATAAYVAAPTPHIGTIPNNSPHGSALGTTTPQSQGLPRTAVGTPDREKFVLDANDDEQKGDDTIAVAPLSTSPHNNAQRVVTRLRTNITSTNAVQPPITAAAPHLTDSPVSFDRPDNNARDTARGIATAQREGNTPVDTTIVAELNAAKEDTHALATLNATGEQAHLSRRTNDADSNTTTGVTIATQTEEVPEAQPEATDNQPKTTANPALQQPPKQLSWFERWFGVSYDEWSASDVPFSTLWDFFKQHLNSQPATHPALENAGTHTPPHLGTPRSNVTLPPNKPAQKIASRALPSDKKQAQHRKSESNNSGFVRKTSPRRAAEALNSAEATATMWTMRTREAQDALVFLISPNKPRMSRAQTHQLPNILRKLRADSVLAGDATTGYTIKDSGFREWLTHNSHEISKVQTRMANAAQAEKEREAEYRREAQANKATHSRASLPRHAVPGRRIVA